MVLKSFTKVVKHEQIRDYLMEIIKDAKHGEVLPSQAQLAEKFNVNHLTVRKAFKKLEGDGLVYRIHGKGTFVRKIPCQEEKLTFLVLLYHNFQKEPTAYRSLVLLSMLNQSSGMGCTLHTINVPEDVDRIGQVDFQGVIGLNPWYRYYHIFYNLKENGAAVILANRIEPDFNFISVDHAYGAREVTERFIKKGHRRISFLGRSGEKFLQLRYGGYHEAMQGHDIEISPDASVEFNPSQMSYLDFEKGIEETIKRHKPSALVVAGSSLIPVALRVFRRKGIRIPQDIEVATYDELDHAVPEKEFIHEIITPTNEIGQALVKELALIAGRQKKSTQMILKPTIVMKDEVS